MLLTIAYPTPDVLSSVNKSKHLFRGLVLLKKSEPSLRGEGINTHTHTCYLSMLMGFFLSVLLKRVFGKVYFDPEPTVSRLTEWERQ